MFLAETGQQSWGKKKPTTRRGPTFAAHLDDATKHFLKPQQKVDKFLLGLDQSLATPTCSNNKWGTLGGGGVGGKLPYYTMDLHTAGNHCDHRLSVTDGVCQRATCSLCFHLAIKPVGSDCHRDPCTIWKCVCVSLSLSLCNSSKYLPVGHHLPCLRGFILLCVRCEAECRKNPAWPPWLSPEAITAAEN